MGLMNLVLNLSLHCLSLKSYLHNIWFRFCGANCFLWSDSVFETHVSLMPLFSSLLRSVKSGGMTVFCCLFFWFMFIGFLQKFGAALPRMKPIEASCKYHKYYIKMWTSPPTIHNSGLSVFMNFDSISKGRDRVQYIEGSYTSPYNWHNLLLFECREVKEKTTHRWWMVLTAA